MATYYEQQMSKLTVEEKRALWREKAQAYRDKHKEQFLSDRRENYKNSEEIQRKVKEASKQWRLDNPEKVLQSSYESNKKYRQENWSRWVLSNIKKRCKQNAIPFDITPEDIPLPEFCPVLGMKLNPGERGYANKGEKRNWESPSVDRVIPELGYVKGNVRVISMRANTIKNNATAEELELVLNYVRASISVNK